MGTDDGLMGSTHHRDRFNLSRCRVESLLESRATYRQNPRGSAVGSDLDLAGDELRQKCLARAILCLSFRRGALDIADGAPISHGNVGKREYHHLYPVAFLRDSGVDEARASVALNCALVTWRTNRTIAAKPPIAYLRDRADAAALGEDQVRQRVASHEIDYDSLGDGDFDGFLEQRANRMAEAFERLASGADWP